MDANHKPRIVHWVHTVQMLNLESPMVHHGSIQDFRFWVGHPVLWPILDALQYIYIYIYTYIYICVCVLYVLYGWCAHFMCIYIYTNLTDGYISYIYDGV